jgi:hypothetical protein
MARVLEDVIVLKLSKLVKDDATEDSIVTEEIHAALEQVTAELVGDGIIVEVVRA